MLGFSLIFGSETWLTSAQFEARFGDQNGSENRPKLASSWLFFYPSLSVDIFVQFWIDFGQLFGRFLVPKSIPKATKNGFPMEAVIFIDLLLIFDRFLVNFDMRDGTDIL